MWAAFINLKCRVRRGDQDEAKLSKRTDGKPSEDRRPSLESPQCLAQCPEHRECSENVC